MSHRPCFQIYGALYVTFFSFLRLIFLNCLLLPAHRELLYLTIQSRVSEIALARLWAGQVAITLDVETRLYQELAVPCLNSPSAPSVAELCPDRDLLEVIIRSFQLRNFGLDKKNKKKKNRHQKKNGNQHPHHSLNDLVARIPSEFHHRLPSVRQYFEMRMIPWPPA